MNRILSLLAAHNSAEASLLRSVTIQRDNFTQYSTARTSNFHNGLVMGETRCGSHAR
jgi:hypothetical protein